MLVVYILFVFFLCATATPLTTSFKSSSVFVNHNSTSTSSHGTHNHFPTAHPHSGQIFSRPIPPTHTRPPVPQHTNSPPPFLAQAHAGQKPISIAFEVLGGIFLSLVLLSIIRCCYNYKKTPHRDRIADILHRHNLQRELEELERNPAVLRRPSLREPAPPYFPRPPSYEDAIPAPPMRAALLQREYSAVATYSPPPSPPMSQRPLPTVTAPSPPHRIPQLPSG